MSNPFDEPDEFMSGEIIEGFLCPICREDLKSFEILTDHLERAHGKEQDALRSIFKNIFTKAKKQMGFEDSTGTVELSRSFEKNTSISGLDTSSTSTSATSTSNSRTRMNVYNFMDRQQVGAERQLLDYFQSIRNPRLERYASETNKLIIRLHKLLKDLPVDPVLRKQHERNTVVWLDGSSVKLCPNCARVFHIARRRHHCRLCGSIMCHDCSKFLALETAMELASLAMPHSEPIKQQPTPTASQSQQQSGIRTCGHCVWLLETRQDMHESRTCCPLVMQIYAEIQQLRKDVTPDIDMYLKIVASLYEGESIFTISNASTLRGKIGQIAEIIDMRSKRILAIPCEQGSREEALKKAIRLSCIQLIKERMLSLPPLPKEDEIRKIQDRKRMEAEQRIATERRMVQEAYDRYDLAGTAERAYHAGAEGNHVQALDLHSMNNWSGHQVSNADISLHDDPLVEQINIIKGYIKQARQDMNFEVVETLELNLRELQREFYIRQQETSTTTSPTNFIESQEEAGVSK